jgi:uncharacterized membrane protein YkoI
MIMEKMIRRFWLPGLMLLAAGLVVSTIARAEAPHIDTQQAMRAALARVPGTVEEVEYHPGLTRAMYEVEIVNASGTEYEVTVDGTSGQVVEAKLDD